MKRIHLICFCLFCSVAAPFSPVHLVAQEKRGDSATALDSLVNPPLLKGSERILSFDSCRKQIGTLSEDDSPRTIKFRFRNVSGSQIGITRVNTSCGCTVAAFEKNLIAPGAESTIALTYHPKNHPGTVDTQAFVYTTASDKQPVARLSLSGNVTSSDLWRHLPYSAGALKMKRKQVVFSEIKSTMKPSERILCGNSGSTPLKLSALMLPSYASFRTEPSVLAPGEEGDLVITIDGSKIPQDREKTDLRFSFLIEGVNVRPSVRTVEVIIKRKH